MGKKEILIYILIILFPAVANLIQSGASVILTLLTLVGIHALFFAKKQPMNMDFSEKFVIWSFIFYFAVYLIFFFLYGFFSPEHSLKWDLGHELRMVAVFPIFLAFLHNGLRKEAFWIGVTSGAIISGIYSCIFIYFLEAGPRVSGSYHPIAFGNLSLAFGFMSIAGIKFFRQKHILLALLPFCAVASGLIAAFLSGTRSTLIAAPVLIIVFLLQLGHYRYSRLFRAVTISFLVLSVLTAYWMPGSSMENRLHSGIEQIRSYISGTDEKPKGGAVRILMWQEALLIFQSNPFTGIGKEGFQKIVREKTKTDPKYESIAKHDTPHNMYLTNAARFGTFGFLITIFIFLVPLIALTKRARQYRASPRDIAYGGIYLIIAFASFALTESIFGRNVYVNTYIIFIAATLALTKEGRLEANSE